VADTTALSFLGVTRVDALCEFDVLDAFHVALGIMTSSDRDPAWPYGNTLSDEQLILATEVATVNEENNRVSIMIIIGRCST